jgi:hypothetical protein
VLVNGKRLGITTSGYQDISSIPPLRWNASKC